MDTINFTKAETEREVKSTLESTMGIMVCNVRQFGSTDECWDKCKAQIIEKHGLTEKGAVMMMRATMSMITGELHPMFK